MSSFTGAVAKIEGAVKNLEKRVGQAEANAAGNLMAIRELQGKVARLEQRIAALEKPKS